MKILTMDDFENVKVVKKVALLAEEAKIDLSSFMKIYKLATWRAKFEGECSEKKWWNLIVRYVDFMKETYSKREEREQLFRDLVLPEFIEIYKDLQGEVLRVKIS